MAGREIPIESRRLDGIRRAMGGFASADQSIPALELAAGVQPTVDILGSIRWRDLLITLDTLDNVTETPFTGMTPGRDAFIPYVQVEHFAAAARTMTLELFEVATPTNYVSISRHRTTAAADPLPMDRPILVPDGFNIRANVGVATGAGLALQIRVAKLDLEPGEYIWYP